MNAFVCLCFCIVVDAEDAVVYKVSLVYTDFFISRHCKWTVYFVCYCTKCIFSLLCRRCYGVGSGLHYWQV